MKQVPVIVEADRPADSVTSIWFVRHAPVATSMLYGQMDVAAKMPAAAARDWLRNQLPGDALWVSSDLDRCVQTAEQVGYPSGERGRLNYRIKALREQHFGDWQGREYAEIEAADPELYKAFWADPVGFAPPGGESFADVALRVERCIVDLLRRHTDRQIVCFCHAGTVRASLSMIRGMRPEATLSFAVDPLSISKIDYFDPADPTSCRVDFVNFRQDG